MVSFDSIRAAHVGAMAYLCKKQPPAELLGCWPLQGNLNDLSRYGRHLLSSTTPTYGTGGLGQYAQGINVTLYTKELTDFSFDAYIATCLNDDHIYFGDLYFEFLNRGVWAVRSSTGYELQFSSPDDFRHFAVTRSNGTVRLYIDGDLKTTFANSSTISTVNIVKYYSGSRWQNMRLVGKAIATGSTFPVPSGLYTGYETL